MRTTLLAIVCGVGLVGPASAQEIGARPFDRGTPVVIIGEISSQPRDFGFFNERKLQVAVGPDKVDHTLHLRGARMVDRLGREIAKSDLQDKWWLRAEGTVMDDPRRIKVTHLELLGKDWDTYRQSAHFRAGHERGYVLAQNVAGKRQVFDSTRLYKVGERVVIVAPISSQPKDAGVTVEEKMQVAVGPGKTDYTLHFHGTPITGPDGAEMAASGLRDRMWVRAEGVVMEDSRRIKVDNLRVIALDEGTYRSGTFFLTGGEMGYIRPVQ